MDGKIVRRKLEKSKKQRAERKIERGALRKDLSQGRETGPRMVKREFQERRLTVAAQTLEDMGIYQEVT